jgi:leucyl/phenylalanyl-tRNA--protein transferase
MNYIKHLSAFFNKIVQDTDLNPTHVSLYMALFQSWNLNRFQNPISITRNEVMRISKIFSKATYHKCVNELHQKGIALSAEAWHNNELVGGLYGIKMGRLFFGESMFSKVSNASKFAFIQLVNQLKLEEIVLIDCQVYTPHLESLGAKMISRADFKNYLEKYG